MAHGMTFRSEALNFDQTVTVFLPEPKDLKLAQAGKPYTENLPVLYLHGHTDNHTAWLRRSNMEAYLHHSDLNMICVCRACRIFGIRIWQTAGRIIRLWLWNCRTLSKRCSALPASVKTALLRAVHGRLRRDADCAEKPDRYAAVASFSGGVDIVNLLVGDMPDAVSKWNWKRCSAKDGGFGNGCGSVPCGGSGCGKRKTLPKMYVSCGTADELTYPAHLAFCKHLKEKGGSLRNLNRKAWPMNGISGTAKAAS
ncbi:MAG: hypothetical protein ACLT0Y_08100 [Christensenellales bacterium]